MLPLQGQDGEVRWVMYQLGYIGTGMLGVIGICVSGCWLAHIIIYMLPPVPIHPLLNDVFIKLDGVFPLFGVAAFAAFCAYLMGKLHATATAAVLRLGALAVAAKHHDTTRQSMCSAWTAAGQHSWRRWLQ